MVVSHETSSKPVFIMVTSQDCRGSSCYINITQQKESVSSNAPIVVELLYSGNFKFFLQTAPLMFWFVNTAFLLTEPPAAPPGYMTFRDTGEQSERICYRDVTSPINELDGQSNSSRGERQMVTASGLRNITYSYTVT